MEAREWGYAKARHGQGGFRGVLKRHRATIEAISAPANVTTVGHSSSGIDVLLTVGMELLCQRVFLYQEVGVPDLFSPVLDVLPSPTKEAAT